MGLYRALVVTVLVFFGVPIHADSTKSLLDQNIACNFQPYPPVGLVLMDHPMVYIGHFSPYKKYSGLTVIGFYTELEQSQGLVIEESPEVVRRLLSQELKGAHPNLTVRVPDAYAFSSEVWRPDQGFPLEHYSKVRTYLECMYDYPH